MTAPPPMDRIAALRQLQEQAKLIHTECSARLDGHTNSAPLARPAEIAVLAIQAPAAYEIVRRALSCHEHAIQPELLDIVEAHLEDWRHHVEAEYSATVAEMQSVERFGGTTDGSISSHLRDIFRQVFTAHCERMEHRVRAAVCASQSEATGRAGLPPSAVEVLVQIYQHRHHLNTVENAIIAKSIGITADQFQNRRNKQRMRHRDALANERTPPPEITDVPQPRRLASALHLPPERAIAVELRLEDAQPVAWADQPYTTSRPPHLHPSLVQQEASNSQPGQGRPLAGGRRMKGLPKRVYQQPRAQNSTDEVDRSLLVSEGSTCSSGWSSSGESSREGSPLPPVFSSPLMHNAAVPQSILVPTSHGFDFGGMSMPTYQMPMPGGMLATQQQPLLPIDQPFAFPACQTQHTGDFSEPLTYSAFEANPAPFGAPGGVQLPFAQDGFPAAVQDQDRPQAFPVSTNANLSIGLGNLMDSSMDMFGLPSGNAAAFSNVLSNVLANGQDLSTVLNGGGSGDMMMWGGGAGAQEAEVATLAQQAATHTSISSDLGMGQNDLGGQGDVDMAAFMEANGGMDFGMDIGIEAGIGAGLDLDADMLAMLSLTFLANSSPPGSIPDSASRAESALGDVNGMDFDFDFALNLDAQSQPMSSPSASWVASSPSSADMSRRSSAPGVPLPFPSIDNILAHIAPLSSITPTSCDATSEPAPATNAMPIVSSATPATYTYGQGQEVSAFDEAAEYGLEDVAWDYVNSSAYSPDEPTFSIQPRPRNITGSTESTVGAASRVVSLASSDVSLVSDASSSSDASATLEPAPVSASRATTPVLSITPPTPGLFEPMRHTMSPAPVHQAESAELASLESMSVEEMNDLLASGGMLVEADMEEDIVSGEGNGQYGLTGLAELPFAEVSDDERME